jgi:uncharacterized protein
VIALAEALGLPFEVKQLDYNGLCHLGPRLLGHSTVSLTKSSRNALLSEEPPDLTISAGHRSVPVVQALRRRSNGRTRSIHVGFPRISPINFELVVTTPQYPIPDHPNLLRIPYPLTRAATAAPDPSDQALLAALRRPRQLLVVGGPTLFWTLDEKALHRTLAEMLGEADGGSVMVTTSPRTPPQLTNEISNILRATDLPTLLAVPGKPPSYAALLEAADSIRVTADSVSMVSDAIWLGKPLALVPIVKAPSGKLVISATDLLRPGRPLYPQDLRLFWRELARIGVGERLSRPATSPDQVLRDVRERVQAVLGR